MKNFIATLLLIIGSIVAAAEPVRILDATTHGGEPWRLVAVAYSMKHGTAIKIEKKSAVDALQEFYHRKADLVILERRVLPQQQYFPVKFFGTMILCAYLPLNNPLTGLSSAQWREIMTGDRLDWAKFSSQNSGVIHRFFLRYDGVGGGLAEKLFKVKNLARAALVMGNTAEAVLLLSSDPKAVAVGLRLPEVSAQVKLLTIDGVAPELKNVLNHTYPWAEVYAVMSQPKPHPAVQGMLKMAESRDFEDAVYQAGMLPLK